MSPVELVPAAEPILVPWGWFHGFLIMVFVIHLLLMNIMVGGSIMALVTGLKRVSHGERRPFQKDVSVKLPVVIALAVNFGVGALLFMQILYGQFFYVSSQLMAVYWLSVIGLLILGYYCAYIYQYKFEALAGLRNGVIGVTVVCFLVISFLFTNNMTLMLNPTTWPRYFVEPGGTLLNLSDPTVIPRYLHFLTASLAVAGIFTAVVWTLKEKKGIPETETNIRRGMRWFTIATLFQILIGFWFQISIPNRIMLLFLGESTLHTTVFIVGLGLVVQALYYGFKNRVWPAAFSLVLLVVVMTVMRDLVRRAYLAPYFKVSDLQVLGQYTPLLAFLIILIVVAAVLVHAIRIGMKQTRKSEEIQPFLTHSNR
ncbi:MAG: hypothetical protein ACOC23_01865 [Thermodesulfobacteriota bacterium]